MPLSMEVGLGLGHIVLDGDPAPPPKKRAQPPVFGPSVVAKWRDQDATWYGGRPQPSPHCDRRGPAPSPERGTAPYFSAHVYGGQTAGWINMPLLIGTEVGLGPGDIVLDREPAPHRKRGGTADAHFSTHVLWKTAGWIKMPLGTEVRLGPGHIV